MFTSSNHGFMASALNFLYRSRTTGLSPEEWHKNTFRDCNSPLLALVIGASFFGRGRSRIVTRRRSAKSTVFTFLRPAALERTTHLTSVEARLGLPWTAYCCRCIQRID